MVEVFRPYEFDCSILARSTNFIFRLPVMPLTAIAQCRVKPVKRLGWSARPAVLSWEDVFGRQCTCAAFSGDEASSSLPLCGLTSL